MIEAIIFDMDGVIVDTEPLHCQSYIKTFNEYGIALAEDEFYDYWTRRGGDIKDFIKTKKLPFNPETIRSRKRIIFHDKLKTELKLYDGIINAIELLSANFPLALATSSFKVDTDIIIKTTNLEKFFQVIVTCDEIKKNKPDPEIFLRTSELLKIDPNNIVVIEDAEKGIIAAHLAGMKSIAIPNKYTLDNNFSLADKILNSAKEITLNLTNNL